MSAEYMQYVRLYAVSLSAPFELLQQTTIRLFNRLHGQQNPSKNVSIASDNETYSIIIGMTVYDNF